MSKHILSIAIILLSISIVYMGFQLSHVGSSKSSEVGKENTEVSFDIHKGLWNIAETAAYLSISEKELKAILIKQDKVRTEVTSYDTYEFIPYIKMRDELYFNKLEVDKWIEHSSQNRDEY